MLTTVWRLFVETGCDIETVSELAASCGYKLTGDNFWEKADGLSN